jgi:hypothetical protein
MRLKETLEIIALIVQMVSLPIAVWSIYWARKEAKNSRDLQIALELSESFRSRWESNWRTTLKEVEEAQSKYHGADVPTKHQVELINMLNWIDWVGTLIKNKSLSNQKVLLGTLSPQFTRIIKAGRSMLEEDIRKEGRDYWGGVLVIVETLGIALTTNDSCTLSGPAGA